MTFDNQLNRSDIDQLKGPAIVEFGASWCGHCQAAQAIIAAAVAKHPNVRHIKIEDGKGQRLGRTYSVKLWPTLVFLKDGVEVNRLVRPTQVDMITDALDLINIS